MEQESENKLFSEQELNSLDGNRPSKDCHQEPVVCLGRTFKDDDERRKYFREELRKKLPELCKIEGFPIGEDNDIINLSDPPYYTACPNPWLNDFITEWEKEKEQLKAEDKRTDNFEVKEPYASDVSEGKNNPIYRVHSYHTKVPHPAIMRYILHYTQPGDIVFDGFCGSGMTGVAANMCESEDAVNSLGEKNVKIGLRHGICSDLSPIATLISASYNLKFDPVEFKKKATKVLKKVDEELGWMYKTKVDGKDAIINYVIWSEVLRCQACGDEIVLWNQSVSEDTKEIYDRFDCPHCGFSCSKKNLDKILETNYDVFLDKAIQTTKYVPVRINYSLVGKKNSRFEIDVRSQDLELLCKINGIGNSRYHTSRVLIGDESARIVNYGISHIHQFYTKRNFLYLSRVFELVKDDPMLLAWFTSVQTNTSKMWKFKPDRKGGSLNGTFYIPSLNIEQNPEKCLKSKIQSFINADYLGRGNSVISLNSATFLNNIRDNSIDYIFIDPPFGSNIMYSELNSVWEGWLKVSTQNEEEAIVNKSQNKSLVEYQGLIKASLREFYRILKPGKWLTMEFSNTSAAVWNSIQTALQGVGFIVVNVAALDKKQGSFKAVTTTTAVKQDLVITCFKPTSTLSEKFQSSGSKTENVWDLVDEMLGHLKVHEKREGKTSAIVERTPKILFDKVISYYVQHGYPVPMGASEFQKGLRERFIEQDGMFFTALQAADYQEKKKDAPDVIPMGIIISDEASAIEWIKIRLRQTPMTYQEIQPEYLRDSQGKKKGDKMPELRTILEENFIEEPSGKWRLPNVQDDKDVNTLRAKSLLREFKIYAEAASKPKAKIKEARVEALRAGFKQCYIDKDFKTIVMVGDKIPQNLREEDEVLLQFYDIARGKL